MTQEQMQKLAEAISDIDKAVRSVKDFVPDDYKDELNQIGIYTDSIENMLNNEECE